MDPWLCRDLPQDGEVSGNSCVTTFHKTASFAMFPGRLQGVTLRSNCFSALSTCLCGFNVVCPWCHGEEVCLEWFAKLQNRWKVNQVEV